MANWAAGAGFSNAFLNTLKGLTDLERSQLEMSEAKRKLEQEKALDVAFANTQGRVGQKDDYGVAIQQASGNTGMDMGQAKILSQQGALSGGTAEDMDFERASAESAAGAMRENAARQGKVADSALPRMEAQEYTSKQAISDYAKEAAKVGGRKGALEALQIKKAFRQDDLDTQFDKTRQGYVDKLAQINGIAESQGMKGLAELANKNGLKVKFEEGKSGVGKINVIGPNGDVLETVTSISDAVAKLEQAATKQFQSNAVGLLGDEAKLLTYLNQREEIGIKREQLNVERQYKGEGGVIDRAYNAKNKQFEDKLPEGKKMYLSTIKANTEKLMQAAATDPSPQNVAAAQRAQFNLFKTYKDMGMSDIDPYQMSGVPTPQQAAAGILGAKPNRVKQKEIDDQVGKAERLFGKDYANEVRAAIDAKREVKRDSKGEVIKTEAIPTSMDSRKSKFYAAKIGEKERALEKEVDPRRRAALQSEIDKLQQFAQ